MGEGTAVKCLDCEQVLKPANIWQACTCGHLYMDGTGETPKVGFVDEDRVEYVDEKKWGPKKPVQRSKDKFTEGGTFL